ncbi:MAG: hypothetical protein Q8N23_02815 [Archangium sp.]|nr:hypothetical protein [Archangium sp.]MDP3569108.1 hypothetical protein [Archangium sp.]
MSSRGRKVETLAFWALLVMSLGLFFWRWSAQTRGLSAEQSESLVLARSIVDGLGLRLTAWSTPSAGPQNLPWLAVQSVVLRAAASPEVWLPRLSLLLMSLALVVVAFRASWVWRRPVQVEDVLPALGLSLSTAAAEVAGLGSGSSGWVLALGVAAVLTGRGMATGQTTAAALAIGTLCLFRPSAVWFLVATVPTWWIAARVEGRPALREAFRFLVAGGFVVGLVFGFRYVVLGSLPVEGLLPSEAGRAATAAFLARQSRWFWAAIAGALVAGVWRRFQLRGGGTVLAWVLMTIGLANWTDSARTLFLGCVPLLAMLVGDGLSASREGTNQQAERPQRSLAWAAFCGLAVLLSLAAATSFSLGPVMEVASSPVVRPEVRQELQRRGLRQPLVGWTDGAEASVLFPDARVVVLKGPTLAMEDLLMSEGPPDVLDSRVVVEGWPRLGAAVTPGPGAWWLAEQSPDDDPRCPDGRLALLSTSPQQLLAQLEADVAEDQVQRGLSRWRCALGALDFSQLPEVRARRVVAETVAARSEVLERQGRLELAVRAASLAASLDGEDVQRRARAERLRSRWLGQSSWPSP